MQHLEVTLLDEDGIDKKTRSVLSESLDGLPKQSISELPWPAYPYRPTVAFAIAHTGRYILLKYYVAEAHLRGVNVEINAPVYEDSCVEFFVAFEEAGYYNLEFNCMGTTLVGYGKDRNDRTLLDTTLIRKILYETKMSNEKEGLYNWELFLMIPVQLFKYHGIQSLNGIQCKANFYKCGDLTHQPHYLCWSKIVAPEPDFHLPQYFGLLKFKYDKKITV